MEHQFQQTSKTSKTNIYLEAGVYDSVRTQGSFHFLFFAGNQRGEKKHPAERGGGGGNRLERTNQELGAPDATMFIAMHELFVIINCHFYHDLLNPSICVSEQVFHSAHEGGPSSVLLAVESGPPPWL